MDGRRAQRRAEWEVGMRDGGRGAWGCVAGPIAHSSSARRANKRIDVDAHSNEYHERMPLGANERASERVCLFRGWDGRNLGVRRGHRARASSPSLARSIRPLASRFVADSISSQGQRNRCTNGRAQFDEWMEMARRRTIPPSLMVGIWCALVGQHACAVWYLMCNASSSFCEVVYVH